MAVVLLTFYKRKAGLTHEEFTSHWRDIHGPLVREMPNFKRYILRYVQHSLTPMGNNPDSFGFDGFSELWLASKEDVDALFSMPLPQECVDDERKFLDMEAKRVMLLDEQQVIFGPAVPL